MGPIISSSFKTEFLDKQSTGMAAYALFHDLSRDVGAAISPSCVRRSCLCFHSPMARQTCIMPARRHRAARIVATSAADAAGYSSQSPWDFMSKSVESISSAELRKQAKSTRKQTFVAGVDQSNLVDPWLLADQDSRFAELYGVQLHYKIAHPQDKSNESTSSNSFQDNSEKTGGAATTKTRSVPSVLLHGFGASLFSWQRVLKPLAAILGASVVAFDRPAFGLTGRPQLEGGGTQVTNKPNPYGSEFSAKATLSFVEFLQAQQVILIGHSAGCLVALQAYLDAPEKVAAMILVAPAVAAPLFMDEIKKAATAPDPEEEQEGRRTESSLRKMKLRLDNAISTARAAVWWVLKQIFNLLQIIKTAVQALFETLFPESVVSRVESVIWRTRERIVTAIIRSKLAIWMVRVVMNRFGTRAVRMAWYNPEKADKHVLAGYTKPLQCKDWERALLEFVLAMAASPCASLKPKNPLGKRLKDVHCPVLVVTGDTDRLVPQWNARRLARALPNAEFALIKQCGHLPQEETPDEFLSLIGNFLGKYFPWNSTSAEFIPVPAT